MNYKKWVFSLIMYSILLVTVIEVKYKIFPTNRHKVDFLVNEYIPNLATKQYDTLIIGDSLAKNAFSNVILHDNIVDLTSNQAISMAGNYFILKRYLKNNNIPKKIFLFCIPDFLHNDLNQIYTYRYFETVFKEPEEIQSVKKIKPDLYNFQFNLDKYFESRKNAINLGGYKSPKRVVITNIEEKTLKRVEHYSNAKIKNTILQYIQQKDRIEDIPFIYLHKILKLCESNNIDFTIVIEPMPAEYDEIYKSSKWNRLLKENKKITYYNINNFYRFSTYFFKHDGTHISGNVNQYYQNLIDRYILDIY